MFRIKTLLGAVLFSGSLTYSQSLYEVKRDSVSLTSLNVKTQPGSNEMKKFSYVLHGYDLSSAQGTSIPGTTVVLTKGSLVLTILVLRSCLRDF